MKKAQDGSQATPKEGVSVVIPVYNEERAVADTIRQIATILHGIPFEIIAVNDCSRDGTSNALEALKEGYLTVVQHRTNRGYGASLKSGIARAAYEWVAITDADGTYPIEKLPALIEEAARADMVVGSRDGAKVADTVPRKVGRSIVRRFASYVCGVPIRDINSGLRIFRKELAKEFWHLFPDRFSFTSTLTVASNARGYTVHYVPIDYRKRIGTSTIRPVQDFIGFMALILRLAVYFNPLRVFVPLSLALFTAAFIVLFVGLSQDIVLDTTFAVLFITSIQIFIFGLLADMIVKKLYDK